ncbi:NAD(+) diphosphatase [Marinisporobacter balticus]|uniref:NAD-capped RNA hydrolase NudC n=1 Tax=Marinisporobacter balticus TaxID=2018667 RepID=A0A4R2LKQ8_9FIRM|nr:NAD(+) diphosphatase [Marinisporobacter balticus]TCO79965.1 NAD+ diphosphatase [Marinisporobacter balticus]
MHFVPGSICLSHENNSAFWFIFRDNMLLIKLNTSTAAIPHMKDLSLLNLSPIRKQYLGKIDNDPCYSVELPINTSAPADMEFIDLRQLYGLMQEDFFWIAGRAIQIMNWDKTHQYCGQCATPTHTKANEYAKVCPQCGLINYPRICPAIIVAIVKDNQLLLAQGTRFTSPFYSVLAGFVEPGENLEACVKREVLEEVGIKVKNISYFGSQPWPFPNSLMVAFTAEYDGGEIVIDETEIKDAGWFKASMLPPIPSSISISRKLIDWFIENYK